METGTRMSNLDQDSLRRLGESGSIDSVCAVRQWSRQEFDQRWKAEIARRVPDYDQHRTNSPFGDVTIQRDRWGIPHISSSDHQSLWFGFGYAMAQDRLFQLDYLRRKGLGRLAEILGADGKSADLIARTVGLNRIAQSESARLPSETMQLLEAFSRGVNAWIADCEHCLPIEFDLLDYRPEVWTPIDCLAIENEFRWYLTGRFPVIVIPELAKRVLGVGPRYDDLLLGEADAEAIVPREAYESLIRDLGGQTWFERAAKHGEAVGQATGDPLGTGSNNWVVAGRYCRSGLPMVASDPHIAIEAVSCWYEAHLCGGDFNVAGMAYVGIPAIMFGRTERVAWGITNNICSQRDLYQERTSADHPDCFEFAGRWEPQRTIKETIAVRNEPPLERTIRFSRNGPIVDEILPPPGDQTGPVSLKWLGAYHGGWLTALLGIDRANSVAEFREALRPWHVPTFNLVIADQGGSIAVQCAGRIPLRPTAERAYRAGWDPGDQWLGLLPFEGLPHALDPQQGWLASANNRLAADDFPFPLYGTWISGYRAVRIREMLEDRIQKLQSDRSAGMTRADFQQMQHDTLSLRAREFLPLLLKAMPQETDPLAVEALQILEQWDCRIESDAVGPAIFNLFFSYWTQQITSQHFSGLAAELLSRQFDVIAGRLLDRDPHGWFAPGERIPAIARAFRQAVQELTARFGANPSDWQWGRLHRIPFAHVLGHRGDLGTLLNQPDAPVKGDMLTVCNTGSGPNWLATTGAGYRLIADLSEPYLFAVDGQSQSGNPGSIHYSDQFHAWSSGDYHILPLRLEDVGSIATHKQILRREAEASAEPRISAERSPKQ